MQPQQQATVAELQAQLEALKSTGKEALAPVQFHLIASLLDKAALQRESVSHQLAATAATRLAALQTRLAQQAPTPAAKPATPATSPLQALTALLQQQKPQSTEKSRGLAFDEFLREQEQAVALSLSDILQTHDATDDNPFGELKSSRLFRQAQLQKFADDLVEQAIADAPQDPGPLNPQMLAIRALSFMRDLSPHYLNRFVSYIDSLFWLEQAEQNLGSDKTDKAKTKGKR